MAESFYTILTNVGKAKIANATALGTKVNFTTLKVGDSNGTYYNPTETQENLVHTVWQGNINSITTDSDNPNWIFIIVPIPSNVGGFTIREVGIFDDEGYMLAIGKYPETYKPQAADGSTKEITIRTILEVSNSASVILKINPTVTLATKEDLETVKNSIPKNASDIGAIANSQIGVTGGVAKQDDLINLGEEVNTHLADNETEFSNLNARINNLNTNDLQARNEIVDIKLKLKEQSAIDFINKTGVGFYDTFADNSNIDPETTASYDSENKRVNFPSVEPYAVKATSGYNDVALINVDKVVGVGDKLNNTNPVVTMTPVDSSVTNTITDATVVNQAYDTSGNGGRKLVRLSNGWLVAVTKITDYFYFYVNKNDGNGFNQLCYMTTTNLDNNDVALASKGTMLYILNGYSTTIVQIRRIEVTTIENIDLYPANNTIVHYQVLDSSQTALGNCSLAINEAGTEIHACWSSKNSTYSNSYNIRYCKGTINSNGSVTWGSVEQLSTNNTTGQDNNSPCIIVLSNGLPRIVNQFTTGSSDYRILCRVFNGTTWTAPSVYGSGTLAYAQSNPCAIFVPQSVNGLTNGRIWVTWVSSDSSDSNAISVAYSDDNGATWSSRAKLSGSNFFAPTIAFNTDNKGFIFCYDNNTNIYRTTWDISTGWTGVVSIISGGGKQYPSAIGEIFNFTLPLFIYMDGQTGQIGVKFRGTWTIETITYDITLTDPVTVSENEELLIYPIEKILKMKDEVFDTFNDLDLSLYVDKINKATIKGDVDNSTTVITGATDKTLTTGDKLFMDGILNEVLNATGNYVTNTVTDATVINQAYNTMGNGGRNLVRLSNGWLICSVIDNTTTGYNIKIYRTQTGDWTDKVEICNISTGGTDSSFSPSIVAIEDKIGILFLQGTNYARFKVIDVSIVQGNLLVYGDDGLLDTQTAVGTTSLAINEAGTEIHACWSSKNSTYSNSYNIRYCKGTINSNGSVTWGSIEQVTVANNASNNFFNPCIIVGNNKVSIFTSFASGSTYNHIRVFSENITGTENTYNGTDWTTHGGSKIVYEGISYGQAFPCAIFVPQSINGLANGRIWVVWHGLDNTDTNYNNIKIAYSDDGGVTWSTPQKLTNGNIVSESVPSITVNKNNEIFVIWHGGNTGTGQYLGLRKIKNINGIWGNIINITNNLVANKDSPSTLVDFLNFTEPLFIYRNIEASKIGFYGTWDVGEGYNLTMQNPVTLTDGQQIPIVDFEVKQNNSNLELDAIDSEKFVFKGSDLNTDNASIKVLGKDNKLNAIAYAIA